MDGEEQLGGGVFHVGRVTGGTVAFGPHSQAHHHEAPRGPAALDETLSALLEAVRGLRNELGALAVTDTTAEAGRELAAVEDEIAGTGAVDGGRLRRLHELVVSGSAGIGALASAGAFAESAMRLLS
jgi:hypothetical protein